MQDDLLASRSGGRIKGREVTGRREPEWQMAVSEALDIGCRQELLIRPRARTPVSCIGE